MEECCHGGPGDAIDTADVIDVSVGHESCHRRQVVACKQRCDSRRIGRSVDDNRCPSPAFSDNEGVCLEQP